MARLSETIEQLEEKLKNSRSQLKQARDDLSIKVESMDRELSDILRFFDLSIIETREDMRIINSYGSAEVMFKPAKKMLDRGGNLIHVVYKTTRNSKSRSEAGIEDYEELEDLEYTIGKFVDSNREQRTINVIGEKDDGEIFLLIWVIVRHDKLFKSYFRIIPTNQIIKETKKRYEKEIKDIRRNARDIYEHISEGITILDLDNKILYMNSNAYKGFLPIENRLLEKATFEGRLFHDIFVTDEQEDIKKRLEQNTKVMLTKKPSKYKMVVGKKEVAYSVNPVFSEKGNVIGLVIVSHILEEEKKNYDEKRLLKTLQSLTEDNRKHIERFKELELNEQWLMQKNTEYQEAIRMYYSFLEAAPMPVAALDILSMKYVFSNSEMEQLLNLSRKDILGKTDAELFGDIDESSYNSQVILESNDTIKLNINGYNAIQKTVFGREGNPVYVIRIFSISGKNEM